MYDAQDLMRLEIGGGTETFQVHWSWQRPILAQIRHGGACYGIFSQGLGEDLTGERSSFFSVKNPAMLTSSPRPWTFTIESPNTTSVPWKGNHLIVPSGERYGRLYFLSQEMESHLQLFDEIWAQIQPRNREVKK